MFTLGIMFTHAIPCDQFKTNNEHMKVVWFIVAMQVLFAVIAIAIIVYLILRRIRLRKQEDFEKRAN